MGSSKKNTASAKSKAKTQTAECIAELEIELKVVGDVCAPTGEHGAETQALTPADETTALKGEPTPAAGEPAAAPEEPAAAPEEPAVVPVEPGGAPAESAAAPPESEARNVSLHASAIPLSLKPEMSVDWPLSRKRQVFNVFYFGLLAYQSSVLAHNSVAPWAALACLAIVVPLAAASVFYLFNHRHHQTSSEDFSPATRRGLRAAALLVPAFLLFGMSRSDIPTQYSPSPTSMDIPATPPPVGATFAGEMALGKRDYNHHRYQSALNHFESAAGIDPASDVAAEWIAETNDSMFRFPEALTAALHSIDLNPDNENAHVIGAHAYNMTGQFSWALQMADEAIALNPDDGEAYGYKSTALNGMGRHAEALIQDNSHVRLHYYEAQAFEQRARTLFNLGRTSEGNYDMQLAENIRKNGSR